VSEAEEHVPWSARPVDAPLGIVAPKVRIDTSRIAAAHAPVNSAPSEGAAWRDRPEMVHCAAARGIWSSARSQPVVIGLVANFDLAWRNFGLENRIRLPDAPLTSLVRHDAVPLEMRRGSSHSDLR